MWQWATQCFFWCTLLYIYGCWGMLWDMRRYSLGSEAEYCSSMVLCFRVPDLFVYTIHKLVTDLGVSLRRGTSLPSVQGITTLAGTTVARDKPSKDITKVQFCSSTFSILYLFQNHITSQHKNKKIHIN